MILNMSSVHKKYKNGFKALENVSFKINQGEIVGLIGPNGAGKTTIVRLILDLLKPTEGDIKIWDSKIEDLTEEYRKQIGFLLDERGLYDELSVEENLIFWSKLYGLDKKVVSDFLKEWKLYDRRRDKVKNLSSGLKQKTALIRVMMTNPEFIILDEPTTALDPVIRKNVVEMLRNLKSEGKTALITSHDLFDIERICSRLIMIRKGRIVFDGTLEELKSHMGVTDITVLHPDKNLDNSVLEELKNHYGIKYVDEKIEFSDCDGNIGEFVGEITGKLLKYDYKITKIENKKASLEELYAEIIGEDES